MATNNGNATNRPDVMESLSETQLSELENQTNENDRDQFNTIAESYGWDSDTCNTVWEWLSSGDQTEGFGGKQR